MPWATLALALVAILTIIHSSIKEERQKNLRRLQNIMEWACDVIDITRIVEIPDTYLTKYPDDKSYERHRQADDISEFKGLYIGGQHINILSLRVSRELCSAVSAVTQAIDDLLKENWLNLDVDVTREWLGEHKKRIYELTQEVVDECTKRIEKM